MNPFWKQIIINTVFNKDHDNYYSSFQLAKGFRKLKIIVTRLLKDITLMAAGILSAAFGLEGFLLPNKFIDGGATGISLLTTELTSIPLYYLLVIINVPFIFLASMIGIAVAN